MVNIES